MMAIVAWALLGLACFCSIAPATTTTGPYQLREPGQSIIQRIDIRGNRRVSVETIRSTIKSRQGEPYSETQLASDLRELYGTGFFEDVQIQQRDGDTGKIITFIVVEKPIILSVEYVGNKSFSDSDILDAYKKNKQTQPIANVWYDPQMIRAAERTIKDLMIQHGKPLGSVHTEIENVPLRTVRIRFVLNEDGDEHR
jgi:outer membrane protein insertion porin family